MAIVLLEIAAGLVLLNALVIWAACGMAGLCSADEERAGIARRS